MNYQTKIRFTSVDDIQEFVKITRNMSGDIDMTHGHDTVDAKSFLGVLSLVGSAMQKSNSVLLSFSDEDDYNTFLQQGRFLVPVSSVS
ncbi:MAG: HPr family phosphocarrier protein [Butyrivibrio sp.]|jgi:hypothetical protein|nr:HPr family phosphocarrier protein [Butyrivibrio sp.]